MVIPLTVYGQFGALNKKYSSPAKPDSAQARATGSVDILADSLQYDKEVDTYVAKGDVEIKEGIRKLTADYVRYNKATEDVYAEGNVVFREGEDVIYSDKMYLNLATKTGMIEKGKILIKQGNFSIVGSEIEKLGENEYEIKRGQFTACNIEGPSAPAWKFTADNTKVTVEGFARTKGMKFYILDVPVFYIPGGFFPVKAERQSGFLLPEIVTSSRDGFKFKESYYWAISKDKDATFYAQFIQNRGVLLGSEFRYFIRQDLKGEWDYKIISDRDYGNTRWELTGRHEQLIGKDLTFKANVDFVSDKDVVLDFGITPAKRAEHLLKSTAYVEKPFTASLLTVEAAYFRNLTVKDNDATFKYLPRATFFTEYIPIMKNKFYTNFYFDLNNFYREQGTTFTRLAFEPRVRLPYSWNGVNFLFNATFYETAYLIDHAANESGSSTSERHAMKVEGDANIQLIRNYNLDFLNLGQMQSLIKPRLKYTFIPNGSSSNISSADPYDRITQQNTITYSFNHYLYALTSGTSKEISVFEVSQTYGFSGNLDPSLDYKGSGGRFSDINSKLTLHPWKDFGYVNQTTWSTGGQGLVSMINSLYYSVPKQYFMNIYHTYSTALNNNEAVFDMGATYKSFDLRYHIRYSFTDQTWINTLYQIVYHPGCWALNLSLIQSVRPRDTTVRLSVDLAGITRTSGPGGMITGGIIP
jgi:LPS-assembly protein